MLTVEASADVNGAHNIVARRTLIAIPVFPQKGATIVTPSATVSFPPFTTYQTLVCVVDSVIGGYSLQPAVTLLDKAVGIEFRIPDSFRANRVGLFHASVLGTSLIAWRAPQGTNVLRGTLSGFWGEVYLQSDESPPFISLLNFRTTRTYLRFSFHVSDAPAGVNADELRITLDDEPLVAEYDPYSGRVTFDETLSLAKGWHVLKVSAKDRMENGTEYTKYFVVQ